MVPETFSDNCLHYEEFAKKHKKRSASMFYADYVRINYTTNTIKYRGIQIMNNPPTAAMGFKSTHIRIGRSNNKKFCK